jgi:hypothetical protein
VRIRIIAEMETPDSFRLRSSPELLPGMLTSLLCTARLTPAHLVPRCDGVQGAVFPIGAYRFSSPCALDVSGSECIGSLIIEKLQQHPAALMAKTSTSLRVCAAAATSLTCVCFCGCAFMRACLPAWVQASRSAIARLQRLPFSISIVPIPTATLRYFQVRGRERRGFI